MLVYGYIWMGIVFVLFLLSLYGMYSRNLFRPGVIISLVFVSGMSFALRVLTYMQFLRIVSFRELDQGVFLFAATLFGTVLLICYTFVLTAIVNLFYPRDLGGRDILVLSCFSGFGISLLSTLYGMGKLLVAYVLRMV